MSGSRDETSYHFVFDGFPSPDGPRLIEIEDSSGRSIELGEWRMRPDGLCELVIPAVRRHAEKTHVSIPHQPLERGLIIYCDGACEPNPGIGGWGFVAYRHGVEIHAESGGSSDSTNNIMEMTAALMALRWITALNIVEPVRLLSDSQYVVKGCNDWRHGWKKKGWKLGAKKPLKNDGLWRDLDAALLLYPLTLEWVKGHAGNTGNERADELATTGRMSVLGSSTELSTSLLERIGPYEQA